MLKRNDEPRPAPLSSEYGDEGERLPSRRIGEDASSRAFPASSHLGSRFVGRALLWAAAMGAFLALMLSGVVRCPTAGLFHVPCPACGSTRTAKALLHLDVAGVFRFNPVALLVIPILVGILWRTLTLVFRDGHAKRLDEEPLGRFFLVALVWAVGLEFVVWGARFFGFLGGPCPL